MKPIVLKFGSSVLTSPETLPEAVHEIYREVRAGRQVVAVVSAIGNTTDRLLARAHQAHPKPPGAFLAELLATGEAESVSLLAMALDRAGIPARGLRAGQLGLLTEGPHTDATPVSVNTHGLRQALAIVPVLVVPGFVGRNPDNETTLLGRGGSDLTALFLAHALGAECRLLKDVDGLYEWDPACSGPKPRRYRKIRFDHALQLDGGVIQHKAVHWAQERTFCFQLGRCNGPAGTCVGSPNTTFNPNPNDISNASQPLRVALLGLGTVGSGVLDLLRRFPDRFTLVGAAVRDPSQHDDKCIPSHRLTTNPNALVAGSADIVVELMGGENPAIDLIRASLRNGKHVVTANKEIVAKYGEELQALATKHGVQWLHSASVGGAVAAVEGVRRVAQKEGIASIEAVLNGTTSFILDRLAEGLDFSDALAEAQRLGFAEADPSRDLDGRDALSKIAILARAGWTNPIDENEIPRQGIEALDASPGTRYRLVARCRQRTDGSLDAEIAPEPIGAGHPFDGLQGEENCVLVRSLLGRVHRFYGKGAGRWPTAESVFADLFDIAQEGVL